MRAKVIDASGLVLGRMASFLAQRLLFGESVVVVNAEKAVISGKRGATLREWKEFLKVGGYREGPLHFRRPNLIVRRTIRGMLPYRRAKGREALKRLKVYNAVPKELEEVEKETIEEASCVKLRCEFITIGELAREIGWRGK